MVVVIVVFVVIFVVIGVEKGICWLLEFNMLLVVVLVLFVLIVGDICFLLDVFVMNVGDYIFNFVLMLFDIYVFDFL